MERVKQFIKIKLRLVIFLLLGSLVFACGPFYPTVYHSPTIDGPIAQDDYDPRKSGQFFGPDLYLMDLVQIYKKLANKPLNFWQQREKSDYFSYSDDTPRPEDIWRAKTKNYDTLREDVPDDYEHNFWLEDDILNDSIAKFEQFKKTYTKQDLTEWVKNENKKLLVMSDYRDSVHEKYIDSLQGDKTQNIATQTNTVESNIFKRVWNYVLSLFGYSKTPDSSSKNNLDNTFNICEQETCDLILKYKGQLQEDYEFQQARLAEFQRKDFLVDKIYKHILENKKGKYYNEANFRLAKYYLLRASSEALEDKTKVSSYTGRNKDSNLLSTAHKMFEEILADKSASLYHSDADNYIYMIDGGIPSMDLLNKRANEVFQSNGSGNYLRSYIDFRDMYAGLIPSEYIPYNATEEQRADVAKNTKSFKNNLVASTSNEMLTWIYFFQEGNEGDIELLKKQYNTYQNDAWLMLISRFMDSSDSEFRTYENKILGMNKNSIAFYTSNFYLIQKYIKSGDLKKANSLLDKLEINYEGRLGNKENNAMYNNFKYLRMLSSGDLISFFKNSNRYPIETYFFANGDTTSDAVWTTPFMDDTAKTVFTQYLTLDKQVEILFTDGIFKSKKNLEFVKMLIFNKAIILERYDIADKLAKDLVANNPSLETDYRQYINATTKEQKEYFGKFVMLRYATVTNYIYDDVLYERRDAYSYNSDVEQVANLSKKIPLKDLDIYTQQHWNYCSDLSTDSSLKYNESIKEAVKNIIGEKEIETAKREFEKTTLENSVKYFGDVLFDYYKKNPKEPTIPEAMYLLVLDSRYGCIGGDAYDSNYNYTPFYKTQKEIKSEYSKKAYNILHYNFPNSTWTKKTPFYF